MTDPIWQSFHPITAHWFTKRMGEPTDVQRQAWPAIAAGRHTLIAAPTGSGKTLAALLPCLDRLIQATLADPGRKKGVRVLYVTPLKALNNDIHHHIFGFIAELKQAALEQQLEWPDLRVGVRTGDTSQSTRASMLRRPPELLVTTPESLYLMLTSIKGRAILRTVEQVIVDEIHDLAADKRGLHLSVTLERLTEWCGRSPQRIGVSATQKPIERMARFLGGWEPWEDNSGGGQAKTAAGDGQPEVEEQEGADGKRGSVHEERENADGERISGDAQRDWDDEEADREDGPRLGQDYRPREVAIIESRMDRQLRLLVTMAERTGRGRGEERVWGPILDKLTGLMEGSKTALIFANNRRLCERLTLRLNDHFGGEIARSHHGSVSREQRLLVERMLKDGELRCLVATSSLELGIDVGHIDLVIQIDSPKSAAAAIQRFGRAGHAVGGISRGVLLARSRSELAEAAVLARAAAARDIEAIRVPRHSLDVLSQQLVAMAATDDWEMGRLAAVLGQSDGYRGLPLAALLATLKVLSGLFPFARPLVEWSGEDGRLSAAAGTAMAAVMGAGTIPQSTGYPVHHAGTRMHIGELDEEYIYESRVGDVFQLGAGAWTIQSIRPDRIYVTEAGSRMGEIPFWKAQPISRSYELGSRIADFLGDLSSRDLMQADTAREAEQWLTATCNMDEPAACALVSYVKGQMAVCAVPTAQRLVIELYVDDLSRQHLVVHSLHGRRFNHTWQLALMLEFEQLTSARIYSGVRDNGFEFVFSEWDPSWLQAISRVDAERLESLLLHALPASPLFGIHFRRIAEISLLLTRGFSRMPGWKRRMRGEDLLREALPYAERFPYIREALQEAIRESLAVPEVKARLRAVASGEVEVKVVNTRFPSPFAAEFMMDFVAEAFYESDAIGRDLQAQVTGVSRTMAEELFGADAMRQAISPEVVRREQERLESAAAPAASAADVCRQLKERGDLTGGELVGLLGEASLPLVSELLEQGRVCRIALAGEERYICADERDFYAGLPADPLSVDFVLKRYIGHRIAFTPEELARRYALDLSQAQAIIARWADARQLEPAPFAEPGKEELWTASAVAARIVRFSLQEFRRQAEPAPAARYASLLAERLGLRLAPQQTVRSLGEEGTELLRQALTRLEGLFLPLSHWESFLLPVRLPGYRPADLDLLCSMGEVRWIGRRPEGEKEGRVAFFLADSHDLYAPYLRSSFPTRYPELLGLLRSRGASFLSAIARERDQLPSETLGQLLELVWEGHVANDQFAPLRIKSPRAAAKGGRSKGFQSGLGRWYALTGDEAVATGLTALSQAPAASQAPASRASFSGDVSALNNGGATSATPAANPDAASAAPAPLSSSISRTEANREAALAAAWVKQLLARFAIITRDIVAAYSPYPWDTLYPVLKRLEDWGMLTRGYFIAGLPGMQYAEKAVVEQLRSPAIWMDGEDTLLVNAADPANPYGLILDWPDHPQAGFARKPSHYLILSKEGWELWLENGGRRIVEMGQTTSGMAAQNRPEEEQRLKRVLQLLLQGGRLKKIQVEAWNGIRTSESPIAPVLARLGAERDREAYVFWPSSFRSPR